jgi:uroporphyrinogen decarboxylase
MNSRERLVAALHHEEPDLVPIDFGSTGSSGINIIAYNRLVKYLGLDLKPPLLFDLFQQLAEPDPEILQITGCDVVMLKRLRPRFNLRIDELKEWTLKDGSKCLVPKEFSPVVNEAGGLDIMDGQTVLARMPKGGYYFDLVDTPHSYVETAGDVDRVSFPEFDEEEIQYLASRAKTLYEGTSYGIVGAFGGSIVETGQRSFGFEKFMVDLMINEDVIGYWMDKLVESHLANLKKYLQAVGPYIQVIQFSDDLGTQNSLLMSRDIYRRLIMPRQQKLYRYVRENYPGITVLIHSCGSIFELLPDLIEAGIQAINPVQISASNMEPARLKKSFGRELVFWGGGADMQFVVRNGSLADIAADVAANISAFKPGGGFVFTQVHNIQENVPPEKIMAIYQAAQENRRYGGPA